MMLASIVLPRPTSSARMARPPIWRSTRWATSIWWGSSLIALASSVTSRSKPGTSAIRSASRRKSYQARSAGGPWSCAANSFRDRSSTAQESSGFVSGAVTRSLTESGDAIWKGGGSRRHPVGWQGARRRPAAGCPRGGGAQRQSRERRPVDRRPRAAEPDRHLAARAAAAHRGVGIRARRHLLSHRARRRRVLDRAHERGTWGARGGHRGVPAQRRGGRPAAMRRAESGLLLLEAMVALVLLGLAV